MAITLYKSAEAAVILRRNRQTILRYARTGKLGSTRPGGREYLFSEDHIQAFLAENETVQPSAPEPKPSRNPRYTH